MNLRIKSLSWLPLAVLLSACPFDNDSSDGSSDAEALSTGLQTMSSGDDEREYFIQLPSDYDDGSGIHAAALGDEKPLIIAYHGYTGAYTNWVGETRAYDLIDVVGDGAIFIAPNGKRDGAGKRVWGGKPDLDFFADLLAELDSRGLQYDSSRIFVAGHSNGGGFSNELGCAYGDVIRGIVTAAGGLVSTACVGSTAVMMMHGSNDPLTNGNTALSTLHYWTIYNGWDVDASVNSPLGPCIDYSFPDKPDNEPYPVLWCEHTQGHSWPDFGSVTAWAFMTSLSEVEPTVEAPPGGGAELATPPRDTSLFVQIEVPAESNRPLFAAITLRPLSFIDNPTCSSPDVILNYPFLVDGLLIPGQVSERIEIPVTYFSFIDQPAFPSEWALNITIYVEGGSTSVIPTPGIDYDLYTPISLISREAELNVSDVLTPSPVADLCGFGG